MSTLRGTAQECLSMAQLVLVSEEVNLSDESAMSDKETKSDKWHFLDEGLWKYSPSLPFLFHKLQISFYTAFWGSLLAKYFIFRTILSKRLF